MKLRTQPDARHESGGIPRECRRLIDPKKMESAISRVLSWAAIHLGRASPPASSSLPGNHAGHVSVPLFGLAPGGVCRAVDVATDAVRSYRTLSPLPFRRMAVCSLLHFPSAHAAQALPGTLPCGARTFLPRPRAGAAAWPTPGMNILRSGDPTPEARPASAPIARRRVRARTVSGGTKWGDAWGIVDPTPSIALIAPALVGQRRPVRIATLDSGQAGGHRRRSRRRQFRQEGIQCIRKRDAGGPGRRLAGPRDHEGDFATALIRIGIDPCRQIAQCGPIHRFVGFRELPRQGRRPLRPEYRRQIRQRRPDSMRGLVQHEGPLLARERLQSLPTRTRAGRQEPLEHEPIGRLAGGRQCRDYRRGPGDRYHAAIRLMRSHHKAITWIADTGCTRVADQRDRRTRL